jgi:hypothetical protein
MSLFTTRPTGRKEAWSQKGIRTQEQTMPTLLKVNQIWMEESPSGLVLLFKLVFTRSADGAGPVIGKIVKRGPSLYTTVRISIGRIIDITTNRANIFIHPSFLLLYVISNRFVALTLTLPPYTPIFE